MGYACDALELDAKELVCESTGVDGAAADDAGGSGSAGSDVPESYKENRE